MLAEIFMLRLETIRGAYTRRWVPGKPRHAAPRLDRLGIGVDQPVEPYEHSRA